MSDLDTLQLDQVDELFRPDCRRSANSAIANTATATTSSVRVYVNAEQEHVFANIDHDSGGR